jgi:hypothetical protein
MERGYTITHTTLCGTGEIHERLWTCPELGTRSSGKIAGAGSVFVWSRVHLVALGGWFLWVTGLYLDMVRLMVISILKSNKAHNLI